ncbi:Gfo/Idh/MocA family protein [Sphingomonas aracearum]|nr:Gfo/Idh/MocA family oxidoreductase [Sphingomonas aracearum]
MTSFNVAVVGLGKMGISHMAIARRTPGLRLGAVCDASSLLGNAVARYTGTPFVQRFDDLMTMPGLDGVIIATPTRLHIDMIRKAVRRGLHVFCEKPMTLTIAESQEAVSLVRQAGVAGQIGYHNRFVGTFAETKRLLGIGAIGRVRHVLAEAYGPVVLKPAGGTWRSSAGEGGGCLFDYAAHPLNLMNWYLGVPEDCRGAQLPRQWSSDVEDAVYATLNFASGATGQVSVNWADETARKMTTRISLWGDHGKIVVDRQELHVFIGAGGAAQPGYRQGWTVRNITELTPHPAFYLRGEEYSAQMEGFAQAMATPSQPYVNDFASAAGTDLTLDLIRVAAQRHAEPPAVTATLKPAPVRRLTLFGRRTGHVGSSAT